MIQNCWQHNIRYMLHQNNLRTVQVGATQLSKEAFVFEESWHFR